MTPGAPELSSGLRKASHISLPPCCFRFDRRYCLGRGYQVGYLTYQPSGLVAPDTFPCRLLTHRFKLGSNESLFRECPHGIIADEVICQWTECRFVPFNPDSFQAPIIRIINGLTTVNSRAILSFSHQLGANRVVLLIDAAEVCTRFYLACILT